MFLNNSDSNKIKSIIRSLKIKAGDSDNPYRVIFNCVEELLKRIEKLEKQVKDLKPEK